MRRKPSRSRTTSSAARRRESTGLGEALEFMRVVWELDHSLRMASKSMGSALGVTGPQRLVIRIVGRFPGVNGGDLASLLHVDPSSLTGVLDRLVRAGFLSRKSDPEDRRRALFALTARGRALDRVRSGTIEAAAVRALDGQPRARIAAARRVLGALVAELSQIRYRRN